MKNEIKRALKWLLYGVPNNNVKAVITVSQPSSRLVGKKILITGGGRGLGFSIAEKCVNEGAEVLIIGRNEETLKKASLKLNNCKYLAYDMTCTSGFKDLINKAVSMLGGLNCLVNNAGISLHEPTYRDVTEEGFDAQFNTNLKGPYFLTQAFFNYLEENKMDKANVLFITSERGLYCDMIPYGLTKVAINSLTQGLGRRYASTGIRVNAIAPGVTASDMVKVDKDGNLYRGVCASKRVFIPEEVAEVAAFLLSDNSGCISGEIVPCNKGNHLRCDWK